MYTNETLSVLDDKQLQTKKNDSEPSSVDRVFINLN